MSSLMKQSAAGEGATQENPIFDVVLPPESAIPAGLVDDEVADGPAAAVPTPTTAPSPQEEALQSAEFGNAADVGAGASGADSAASLPGSEVPDRMTPEANDATDDQDDDDISLVPQKTEPPLTRTKLKNKFWKKKSPVSPPSSTATVEEEDDRKFHPPGMGAPDATVSSSGLERVQLTLAEEETSHD